MALSTISDTIYARARVFQRKTASLNILGGARLSDESSRYAAGVAIKCMAERFACHSRIPSPVENILGRRAFLSVLF
jgi:hypothetical protein